MKRWAISKRRGLDLVRSTAVAENLLTGPAGPSGDAPLPPDLSENVMRPLARLSRLRAGEQAIELARVLNEREANIQRQAAWRSDPRAGKSPFAS